MQGQCTTEFTESTEFFMLFLCELSVLGGEKKGMERLYRKAVKLQRLIPTFRDSTNKNISEQCGGPPYFCTVCIYAM